MIDRKLLRQHPDDLERRLQAKRPEVRLGPVLKLDEQLRELTTKRESLRSEKKKLGAAVPTLKGAERTRLLTELKKLDAEEERAAAAQDDCAKRFEALLLTLPNLPAPDVKIGAGEQNNDVLREVGSKPTFKTRARSYLDITNDLDLADLARAAKTSGSRFVFLKGALAKLEFALVRYAFDIAEEMGHTPVVPPVLINRRSMAGMGYLEHGGADEVYHLPKDDLFLVGTAEQAIGPMYQDEVLKKETLPLRFAAFSTCFRREAGSYGKDTKGLIRVHQFDKVELFSFTDAESSDAEHERILGIEERLMQSLELPYRVIKMCSGDLGDPAARKYDIEAWLPGQGTYRETHSTSTCTDFQARRLNIRYRDGNASRFVHTVNGTAFAIGRTLVAIIENYQTEGRGFRVPKALVPYCGFSSVDASPATEHDR